jgi:hypothetical protein
LAALESGNEIDPGNLPSSVGLEVREHIARIVSECPPGFALVAIAPHGRSRSDDRYYNTKRGARSITVEGQAASIRIKAERARRDMANRFWLEKIGGCFWIALRDWNLNELVVGVIEFVVFF